MPELNEKFSLYDIDNGGYFFICHPYSHPNSLVVEERMHQIDDYTVSLMSAGLSVYSPVRHNLGPIDAGLRMKFDEGDLPDLDYKLYLEQNTGMVMSCDALIVVQLAGWSYSPGVQAEINFCTENCPDTPIVTPPPETMFSDPLMVEIFTG